MIECKVCNCKFNAVIEKHYIARDETKTGLTAAFMTSDEESLYDAFDCPMCGCQIIAQKRKRKYTLISFEELEKKKKKRRRMKNDKS